LQIHPLRRSRDRRLPAGLQQPPRKRHRPGRGAARQRHLRHLRRRQGDRQHRHGQSVRPWRLARRLLPRPDVHVGDADVERPRVLRPALRQRRPRGGACVGRAADGQPLRDPLSRRQRRVPAQRRHAELERGRVQRCRLDAEAGRPGLRLQAIPGEPPAQGRRGRLFGERRRGRVWDYAALGEPYATAIDKVRREHKPALIHVTELTQPQGHSTSGSHERYKSKERLRFENEYDCVARMRDWIIESGVASESQLEGWEAADKEAVEAARDLAWEAFQAPIRVERDKAVAILRRIDMPEVAEITNSLDEAHKVTRSLVMSSASRALHRLRGLESPAPTELAKFVAAYRRENDDRYNSFLYSSSAESPLHVPVAPPVYSEKSPTVD